MANERSRREILTASAALAGGAGAALIASCGGDSKTNSTQTVSTIQMQDDAAILNTLLDLESSAIVAYDEIGRKLTGRSAALAARLRSQEVAHAVALRRLIPPLGHQPEPAKSPAEYAATFPALSDAHSALAFALDVENTAIGAYADAIAKLVTDDVRARVAAILATESEHAAVVLGQLGRPQAPQAFVTGPPAQGSG
jgi:rubrerythrin